MTPAPALRSAIAAHRFGLGEAGLDVIGGDPAGWLAGQIGPGDAARGDGLVASVEALRRQEALLRERPERRAASAPLDAEAAVPLRALVEADLRSRLATAATTARPFTERLVLFWANHFTVSTLKAPVRGLAGAFEREAIRPHVAGPFEALLGHALRHPAMLRYLDNARSAGPDSRVVGLLARRAAREDAPPRISGLNENLAREVLELHTLGVDGGYTQRDVTEFARLLTGWRVAGGRRLDALADGDSATVFDPAWHEPGPKTVLGRRYAEGPQALGELLRDLAQHPSTARFLARKLARHFVADDPPPALVQRLAGAYSASGGELAAVYRQLIDAPECWAATPAKLKTPEEFVVSTARVLGLGERLVERGRDAGLHALGQPLQAAPSPAGWPDRADDWLGPDALWKRVEWATRVTARAGRWVDARALARQSLGPALGAATAREIDRAADGPQALALLLLAPEFQRR